MKSQTPGRPVFRKPPPEGVVEVLGIGREWSIAQLGDGSLLAASKRRCRLSQDGVPPGEREQELPDPVSAWGRPEGRRDACADGVLKDDYRTRVIRLTGEAWRVDRRR